MNLILSVAACIIITQIFVLAAKKLKISSVIGLLLAGILIGSPFVSNLVLGENTAIIFEIGTVGFLLLMFIAGMEVSWSMLFEEKRGALIVAFFAAVIPFLLGSIAMVLLGFDLVSAVTVGICMSITAEATKARVLMEFGKLKTKLGSLMLGAGILDDLVGLAMFIIVIFFVTNRFISGELFLVIGAMVSFFLGIAVHKKIGRHTREISLLEKLALVLVIPFFFVAMGLNFSLQALFVNPLLVGIIVAVAIAGKILGSMLSKPLTKLKYKQLHLIGWGMNSRGAVELALAFVAFNVGLISVDLYSGLVVMAFVTTLAFPFAFKIMLKRDPEIMNI